MLLQGHHRTTTLKKGFGSMVQFVRTSNQPVRCSVRLSTRGEAPSHDYLLILWVVGRYMVGIPVTGRASGLRNFDSAGKNR